ncbi:MAG: type II secretion system protein [Planctomycetota bacterium]
MLRRSTRQAFTLVELLVTLTIIAVVLGIALPTFSHVRTSADESFDLNYSRQSSIALLTFAGDNKGRLPALESIREGQKNPGIDMPGSRLTWIDVLLNEGYADSPMMFTDSTIDTSGGDGTYGNAIGLIRYHYSSYALRCQPTRDSWIDISPPSISTNPFSDYTWAGRGIRHGWGPDIETIHKPSEKFMTAEAVEGSAWAGLSAWRGTANIRHRNYTGHYTYFDGSVAALTFEDVFGAPYDENPEPIGPAPADTWLYNLRHLGMTGGFNNKQYGHHYTSAETFPAWAPWMP